MSANNYIKGNSVQALKKNWIYSYFNVGMPGQNLPLLYSFQTTGLGIRGKKSTEDHFIINNFYLDEEASSSYVKREVHKEIEKQFYNAGINSTENLYINKTKFKINFMLGINDNRDVEYTLFWGAGTFGLRRKGNKYEKESCLENFQLINQLKDSNQIKSKQFSFIYDNKTDKDNGLFIFGEGLYDYDNKRFKEENIIYLNAYKEKNDADWSIFIDYEEFNKKKYYEDKNSGYFKLRPDIGYIIIRDELYFNIRDELFTVAINKGDCKAFQSEVERPFYISCKSNFNTSTIKPVQFTNKNKSFNFILEHNELFQDIIINGEKRKIFLIVSDNTENIFGKSFFNKYYVTFNMDKDMIGVYSKVLKGNEEEEISEKHMIIIFALSILLTMILIGVCIYIIIKRHKDVENGTFMNLDVEVDGNVELKLD